MSDDTESTFKPYFWQYSHVLFVSMSITFILVALVEFSFSTVFKQNTVVCLILFKGVFAGVQQYLYYSLSEKLIVSPFVLVMQLTQFVMKVGAEGFITFVVANMVEFLMALAVRMFAKPLSGEAMIYKDVLQAKQTAKKRGEAIKEIDSRLLRKKFMVE